MTTRRPWMHWFTTVLQLLGGLLVAGGLAMVWIPAGVIAAGLLLVALGHLLDREEAPR